MGICGDGSSRVELLDWAAPRLAVPRDLAAAPPCLRASDPSAGPLSLRHILEQAQALSDLKEPNPVKVHNIAALGVPRGLRVNSSSYGNHVRKGKAFFRILAPPAKGGGVHHKRAPAAEYVDIDCVARDQCGRLAEVFLQEDFEPATLLLGVHDLALQRAIRHIADDPVANLVHFWLEDVRINGPDAVPHRGAGTPPAAVRVRLYMSDDDDRDVLTSLPTATLRDLLRSLVVDPSDWPSAMVAADELTGTAVVDAVATSTATVSPTFDDFLRRADILEMFNLLHGRPITPGAPLSALDEAEAASHDELNARQLEAVRNALKCTISCILGPPGTGKTRTIAAIADVTVARGRRLLVMAPANAASRRLLESIVSAGAQECAC